MASFPLALPTKFGFRDRQRQVFGPSWAPGHIKKIDWLLHKNMLWCKTSVTAWAAVARWTGCSSLNLGLWTAKTSSSDIVATMFDKAKSEFRKGVRTMVMIILWEIWQERNN